MQYLNRIATNIWTRESAGLDFLRLSLCAILFTHGAYRWYEGSLPVLGQILTSVGFPAGELLANLVNLAETGGTILLALRLGVWPVTCVLITIYATGIALFHSHEGFFVVGPGTGGWEYSALIIVTLIVTAWANRDHKVL